MSRGIADRHSINQNNTLHPVLFDMLCTYLNTVHPNLFGLTDQFAFTSLIVARNAQCRFHLDADNRGPACIVGVGNYRGGDLLLDVGRSNRRIDRLSQVPVIPRVAHPQNESDSDGQEDQQNGTDDMDESDSQWPWTSGGGDHDVWGGL